MITGDRAGSGVLTVPRAGSPPCRGFPRGVWDAGRCFATQGHVGARWRGEVFGAEHPLHGCRMQLEDARRGTRLCRASGSPGVSSGPGVPRCAALCRAVPSCPPCPSSPGRVARCYDDRRGRLKIANGCLFRGFLLRAHLQTAPRSPSAAPWVQGLPGDPPAAAMGPGVGSGSGAPVGGPMYSAPHALPPPPKK